MSTVKEVKRRLGWCGKEHVAVAIWCETDVLNRAEELDIPCTQAEAQEIIDDIGENQDCSFGISWDTLEDALYHMQHLRDTAAAQAAAEARLEDR